MAAILDRRKTIAACIADSEAAGGGEKLKRSMGVWSVTALGVGAIIGTGIFVLTG